MKPGTQSAPSEMINGGLDKEILHTRLNGEEVSDFKCGTKWTDNNSNHWGNLLIAAIANTKLANIVSWMGLHRLSGSGSAQMAR